MEYYKKISEGEFTVPGRMELTRLAEELGVRLPKDTPAQRNVQAKTGTLRWANSLSGYLKTAAGERLAFCIMLNRYDAPDDTRRARREIDKVVLWLVGLNERTQP